MYQFVTNYPLAQSKTYLEDPLSATEILEECIDLANEFRKTKKKKPITTSDIENGCRLLKINEHINPKARNLLGPEMTPNIDNLTRLPAD